MWKRSEVSIGGNDEADIDYAMIYENRFKVLKMAFARFDIENEVL